MRKWILTALAIVIILAVAGFLVLRGHGFSAREKPSALEGFLAHKLRSLASEPDARTLKNPLEANPLAVAEARDHFADHCATCHGNRGDGKTYINGGLYPPAPDMRAPETQNLSDGEIFYIIKNGIRFTGMPGWGGSDEDNWKLVLFIRHLPDLTPLELQLMNDVNHLEGTSGADDDAGADNDHAHDHAGAGDAGHDHTHADHDDGDYGHDHTGH